jgi:ergothioneine biosynthesis protein EgtB
MAPTTSIPTPVATTPALLPDSLSPQKLLPRFRTVRALTVAWSRLLTEEDQMVQSCAEASPVKWHLAHSAWFFETFVLRPYDPNYKPLNPDFLWLFNSYYNLVSDQPDKSLRASFSRPSLQQVLDYRAHVDQAVDRLLSANALSLAALTTIDIGLHHEQQHQELIATDIKHAFFTNPLHPALRPLESPLPTAAAASSSPAWLSLNPGLISIGHDGDEFSFDNERPRHPYFIGEFSLARSLVSCRDYLAFIQDGGYSKNNLWLSAGSDDIRANHIAAPLYWRRDPNNDWEIFTLHGFMPLSVLADTPVCHLSYYEADAFAHWAGARLPSEFEWEIAAASHTPDNSGFLDIHALQHGVLQPTRLDALYGSLWQWTHSAYSPYPGYRPLEGALGEYNGKFMSGQMVLRGGSIVTPTDHIRPTYRNFFHPPTRWQFSGIRLAKSPS